MGKELFSFFQLYGDRFFGPAVFRIKRLIVAIRATSLPLGSIPIGAGKTGIQGYFLYYIREITPQKLRKFVV